MTDKNIYKVFSPRSLASYMQSSRMSDANAPTHGGPRPGAGRKHLDGTPPGGEAEDQSERRTVTMPASYWAVVKDVGRGVYSVGLRIIIESLIEEWDAEHQEMEEEWAELAQP